MQKSIFWTIGPAATRRPKLKTAKAITVLTLLSTVFMVLECRDASAQTSRLELGRRVRRLEQAWEVAKEEQRTAALKPLKNAVASFFSLRLSEAGRNIDNAWLQLHGSELNSTFELSLIGRTLLPVPLIGDTRVDEVKVRVAEFYESDQQPPEGTRLNLRLKLSTGKVVAEKSFVLTDDSEPVPWKTGSLPEGDHQILAEFQQENQKFPLPPITISRVKDLESRLVALEDYLKTTKSKPQNQDHLGGATVSVDATVRNELALFQQMVAGQSQEADFPVFARLKFCEALVSTSRRRGDFSELLETNQQCWLTLTSKKRSIRTRIQLPDSRDRPLPVLFVFHGAGGSENMFFENYGAGQVVRHASERGWLVVSPGQGLFGMALNIEEMLSSLSSFVECDRERVMLLGHSMGAMQVQTQFKLYPQLPIAAVAIGGGRRLTIDQGEQPSQTRWYVTAGADDFGRSGALQLYTSLKKTGIDAQYQETSPAEHLTSVQASTPLIFEFLDKTLGAAERSTSE